jgi:hypothetical protein
MIEVGSLIFGLYFSIVDNSMVIVKTELIMPAYSVLRSGMHFVIH